MADLILSTSSAPTKFSFKDAKLNELSGKISLQIAEMNSLVMDARERAERINSALAPLFGEVLSTKCYEKDGFKSVAEYADTTFGIKRSMSYLLARVGRDFYNEDTEETRKARETLTVSRIDAMGDVDRVALANAIDNGEITSETSLDDCRAFGAAHRRKGKEPKEKVLPTFDIYRMPRRDKDKPICTGVLKDDFGLAVAEYATADEEPEAFKIVGVVLEKDKASAAKHFIAYTPEGACHMFEYWQHTESTVKKAHKGSSGKPMSLKDYLAGLSPEERKQAIQEALGE